MFKGRVSFTVIVSAVLLFAGNPVQAGYGERICNNKGMKCVKVKRGDSWRKLFPNARQRNLVKRLNRMNTRLRSGKIIAVPVKLSGLKLKDISPFPERIRPSKRSKIFVNQDQLAWAAYNHRGKLMRWGPMSGGQAYCSDTKERCSTPSGKYTVFRKEGRDCKSATFPINKGGSPMPYCTFFKGGIAIHGSSEVPGYHASHGCVRVYKEDARWINEKFVKMSSTLVYVDRSLPGSKKADKWLAGSGGSKGKGSLDENPWH